MSDTSDLAEDVGTVVDGLQAMRAQIGELQAELDEDERRAKAFPHRERQLRLVRSLGQRLRDAHREWLDEVDEVLGNGSRDRPL